MGRVGRITIRVGLLVGLIGLAVFVARRLMGGLGPETGLKDAPTEYPSLVPEPPATDPAPSTPTDG